LVDEEDVSCLLRNLVAGVTKAASALTGPPWPLLAAASLAAGLELVGRKGQLASY